MAFPISSFGQIPGGTVEPRRQTESPHGDEPASLPSEQTSAAAQDQTTLSPEAQQPEETSPGFLANLKSSLGALAGGMKPLDFADEEREEGLKAAGTLERLAGPDKQWDSSDISKNLAQMGFRKGILGSAERSVVTSKLMSTHQVDPSQEEKLIEDAQRLKSENPGIETLRKLEAIDPSKITDPEKLDKYNKLKEELTESLGQKGLLPISVPDLKNLGSSSDLLKEKLGERGIPSPQPGKPVSVDPFRKLFEGQAPLSTLIPDAKSP